MIPTAFFLVISDGVGRSGTYVLIDMVLNRMMKGSKEIDIAAKACTNTHIVPHDNE